MKVEKIATIIIALLITFLTGLSVQSTRALSETVDLLKKRLLTQEEQSSSIKSEMNSISGELIRLKETNQVLTQQSLKEQVVEIIREDREKQAIVQIEKQKVRILKSKIENEKIRIQKIQSQIDAAKQNLDLADKNLEVEILTSVVTKSVQRKIESFSQSSLLANTRSSNEISKASLKGADRFGEVPYREPTAVSLKSQQDTSDDSISIPPELLAKKTALIAERKKLWAQQRTLDEQKRKLTSNTAKLDLNYETTLN
jgi:hypothetical protein